MNFKNKLCQYSSKYRDVEYNYKTCEEKLAFSPRNNLHYKINFISQISSRIHTVEL